MKVIHPEGLIRIQLICCDKLAGCFVGDHTVKARPILHFWLDAPMPKGIRGVFWVSGPVGTNIIHQPIDPGIVDS